MKKKTPVARKNTRQIRKNTEKTVKKTRKRGKKGSDAIKAFFLTAAIVIFSLSVSIAVITVHSLLKKNAAAANDYLPLSQIDDNISAKPETAERTNPKPVAVIVDTPAGGEPQQSSKNGGSTNKTQKTVDTSAAVQAQKPENTTNAVNARKPVDASAAAQTQKTVNTTDAVQPQTAAQKPALGAILFIIDDAGNNLRELEPFLRIPYPFTIAVLPGLPNSAEAARRIRAAGKEVFLHQPMEAVNGQNPGPCAIYSGMTDDKIREILKQNIAGIGPVAGMNNHQGSKITMDEKMMETILSFCTEEKIIFVDSRTTAGTKAPDAARKLGIKIQERDVFLDNEQDRASMLNYLSTGLERARKNGKAIMIGHAWSPELAPLLAEELPKLIEQGYTLSTPSGINR